METKRIRRTDVSLISNIVIFEKEVTPRNWRAEPLRFEKMICDPRTICHAILNDASDLIGYFALVLSEQLSDLLFKYDRALPQSGLLYLESLVMVPPHNNPESEMHGNIVQVIKEVARPQHKVIGMHLCPHLSKLYQKRFGAQFRRNVDIWRPEQIAHDYVEFDLTDDGSAGAPVSLSPRPSGGTAKASVVI